MSKTQIVVLVIFIIGVCLAIFGTYREININSGLLFITIGLIIMGLTGIMLIVMLCNRR